MITNCPDCKMFISDKMRSCPHCGYPFQPYVPGDPDSLKAKDHVEKKRRRQISGETGQIVKFMPRENQRR